MGSCDGIHRGIFSQVGRIKFGGLVAGIVTGTEIIVDFAEDSYSETGVGEHFTELRTEPHRISR